jgi:hypothetical protein
MSMKRHAVPVVLLLFLANLFSENVLAQSCDPINQPRLKEILIQMGYTVKDLVTTPGKEKYEINVSKTDLNVPVAYEISSSTNYIWLTTFLGKAPVDVSLNNYALLKQNSKIQPALFYITDAGNLMMGLPVDNRGINNALIKRYTDFISSKVSETKSYWQNQ